MPQNTTFKSASGRSQVSIWVDLTVASGSGPFAKIAVELVHQFLQVPWGNGQNV